MIKYQAELYNNTIETVKVSQESRDRSAAKMFESQGFFDTWEDAHSFLLEKADFKAKYAAELMKAAEKTYQHIKSMKE